MTLKSRRDSAFRTFLATLTIFALFSGAVALGWLYPFDLWALSVSQTWTTESLDRLGDAFSTIGGLRISIAALAVLGIWLFSTNRRVLAVRLAIALLVTSLVELSMKMLLPQAAMPEDTGRSTGYSPLVDVPYAHPYPSGHMLRSVLLLGVVFVLWKNRTARSLIVAALLGMAVSRMYLGVHWASDVIGGTLLGLAGLAWIFYHRKGGSKAWK
ncbi:MAG: phosphatase PAP2 family protein [Rubrobacteraceae bacterium]